MKIQTGAIRIAAVAFIGTVAGTALAQSKLPELWGSHVVDVQAQPAQAPQPSKIKCYAPGANPVYGKCVNGKFVGYFSQTGKPVYGDCVRGGAMRGYNPENGSPVYGRCE